MDRTPGPSHDPATRPEPGTHAGTRHTGASRLALLSICELLGIFTHDLSNPLQTVMMQLELLQESLAHDPIAHRRIQSITRANEDFHTLLRNLADYAHQRASAGITGSVRATFARLRDLMHSRLEHRNMRWDQRFSPFAPMQHECGTLEFAVLHVLIDLAYGRHQGPRRDLVLDSHVALLDTLAPPQPSTLRVTFTLARHPPQQDPERVIIDARKLVDTLNTAGPDLRACTLPTGELQLDATLWPLRR